jgi:hypothetical protein
MNIVTVFNYPDNPRYNIMFQVWLLTLLRHKTDCIQNIRILTKGLSEPIQQFIQWLRREDIQIVLCDGVEVDDPNKVARHNIGFKLWNMCKETEPYIFIDADTVILSPLDEPVRASKDGYIIGVDHQTIPRHTDRFDFKFINTGFLIVPDPSLMDYEKIVNEPVIHDCLGTDQRLIYNYLKIHQDTYLHPLVGHGWNSCAGYKKITKEGVYSHGIPEQYKVHILHYWDEFKPWYRPCPIFNMYAKYAMSIDFEKDPNEIIQKVPVINRS